MVVAEIRPNGHSARIAQKHLAVTGDQHFLSRYRGLLSALSAHVARVTAVPSGNLMELSLVRAAFKVSKGTFAEKHLAAYLSSLDRRSLGYRARSKQTERKIGRLADCPDVTLHIFSSFRPFWRRSDVPYAMYLDFTMAQAAREWSPWATFPNTREYDRWIEFERCSYHGAGVLFTMGSNARDSLLRDYAIPAGKVHVVGSGGAFERPYAGAKTFGTRQVLFQGSDFVRKGGDLVLAAWPAVHSRLPDARLVVIGTDSQIDLPGVLNLGHVSSRERLERLFLDTDLVVAPARCDPFTAFVIEAMSYGVPCLVARTSGVSSVISDGIDGAIEETPTAAGLAERMLTLLGSPVTLQNLSAGARLLVAARLNWTTVAAGIMRGLDLSASTENGPPVGV